MGSSSRKQTSSQTSSSTSTTNTTNNRTTNNTDARTQTFDSRDLSDNRTFDIVDNSIDKRAILDDAIQILDSTYINVDPSDATLKATIAAWESTAKDLLRARETDVAALSDLLDQIIGAADSAQIAVTDAQRRQLEIWEDQIQAVTTLIGDTLDRGADLVDRGADLVDSAGDRGADLVYQGADLVDSAGDRGLEGLQYTLDRSGQLIESAGARQDKLTDRVLDLAAGSLGQTTNTQIRLIGTVLAGIAGVLALQAVARKFT